MFYHHWKNIALTLTAMFWASCGNDSSSVSEPQPIPLYGDEPVYGDPIIESSSDGATQSSSSEEPASSSVMAKSSSSDAAESSSSDAAKSSSSVIAGSSSSFELPVPVYGVEPLNCYNDTAVNDSGRVFDTIECPEKPQN